MIMKKIKVLSILLACVLLLCACGSNKNPGRNDINQETAQTETPSANSEKDTSQPEDKAQAANNTPPEDWEPNPISDFDYSYDDNLAGVEVQYKGESERVWFPSEINGDPVVAIGQIRSDPNVVKEVLLCNAMK